MSSGQSSAESVIGWGEGVNASENGLGGCSSQSSGEATGEVCVVGVVRMDLEDEFRRLVIYRDDVLGGIESDEGNEDSLPDLLGGENVVDSFVNRGRLGNDDDSSASDGVDDDEEVSSVSVGEVVESTMGGVDFDSIECLD